MLILDVDEYLAMSLEVRKDEGEYLVAVVEAYTAHCRPIWLADKPDDTEFFDILDRLDAGVKNCKEQIDIRSLLIAYEQLSDEIMRMVIEQPHLADRHPPDDANAGFVRFHDRDCTNCNVRYPAILYHTDTESVQLCVYCFFGLEPKSPLPQENPRPSI